MNLPDYSLLVSGKADIYISNILCPRYMDDNFLKFSGDLAAAVRNRTDIHFGLYHSMFEWFHPLYLKDKANKFQTNLFVQVNTHSYPPTTFALS